MIRFYWFKIQRLDCHQTTKDQFNYSMQEYTNINIQIIYNEKYLMSDWMIDWCPAANISCIFSKRTSSIIFKNYLLLFTKMKEGWKNRATTLYCHWKRMEPGPAFEGAGPIVSVKPSVLLCVLVHPGVDNSSMGPNWGKLVQLA